MYHGCLASSISLTLADEIIKINGANFWQVGLDDMIQLINVSFTGR